MPIDTQNYYTTLGLQIDASIDNIKKGYRKLALTHHPDKGGNEEEFKKIVEAYECLSNPEERIKYDKEQMHQAFDYPSSTHPKDNSFQIQKEDWDVFENLARKILTVINPFKKNIYIGPSDSVGTSGLHTFKIGNAHAEDTLNNLDDEERQNFINIVLLFQHRFMSEKKSSSAIKMHDLEDFNPEYDDSVHHNNQFHTRLRYNAKVVKTIALLAKKQDEKVKKLLDEYQLALNYTIYFNNEIAANLFPAFKISINTENETLQFVFSKNDNICKTLNEDEISKQQHDLKKWIHENYSLSNIEQESSITYNKTKDPVVQCSIIISKLTANDKDKITEATIAENEKKVIEHVINNIKYYIERKEYEKIDEEVEKLQTRNINISKVDELTKTQNKTSLLMHAIKHGAPLHVIEYLVAEGSSLDYDRTGSAHRTNLFIQAIQFSPLDVVAYLYEKLGHPDLNSITMQDEENMSVLLTAIVSIPQIRIVDEGIFGDFYKAKHDRGLEVVNFLIENGAHLRDNEHKLNNQLLRNIAQDIKINYFIQRARQLYTENGDEKKDSHLEPDSLAKILTDLNRLEDSIFDVISNEQLTILLKNLEKVAEHTNEWGTMYKIIDTLPLIEREKIQYLPRIAATGHPQAMLEVATFALSDYFPPLEQSIPWALTCIRFLENVTLPTLEKETPQSADFTNLKYKLNKLRDNHKKILPPIIPEDQQAFEALVENMISLKNSKNREANPNTDTFTLSFDLFKTEKNKDKQLHQQDQATTGRIVSALITPVDKSANLPQDQKNKASTSPPLQPDFTQRPDNNKGKIFHDDSPQDQINIFHFIFGSEPQKIKLDEITGNFIITFNNNQINITKEKYQQFREEICTAHENALTELKNYEDYLTKKDQAPESMFFASDSSQSKKTEITKLREILEQSASTPGNQAANMIKLRGNLNNSALATFRDGWILWLLKRVTIIPWFLNASGISKAKGGKVVNHLQAITAPKKSI